MASLSVGAQLHGTGPAARQQHCSQAWLLSPHPPPSNSRRRIVPAQPQHTQRQQQAQRAAPVLPQASNKAANNSFDAEEDLDTDLAEELARFRTPDAWDKVAKHLDLVWEVGQVARGRGKRSMCSCCEGTGEEECSWCHGTGAMMVGDTLFRSADGGSHCPVCKGKGYLPCENCRGTGYRAAWMQGPDQCPRKPNPA